MQLEVIDEKLVSPLKRLNFLGIYTLIFALYCESLEIANKALLTHNPRRMLSVSLA